MNMHEWSEYMAEVFIRKAVQYYAKINPKSLDMRTHTFVNGKRYLIHIRRGDYKNFEPQKSEDEQ